MSAQIDPRRRSPASVEPKYYYRRKLSARELLPAVGAGIGAGLVAFYLTKLFLERTPLASSAGESERPRLTLHRSSTRANARNAGRQ